MQEKRHKFYGMQTIKLIPLGNISIIGNYRDVAPPKETDPDIIELAASIAKDDVMQSILVRPDKKKADHFQVIFGHRRFIASKVAKKTTIPASIKEVSDDDILELQVTENLQRKDVHPMDEAVAYQQLMKKKKYTVQEISSRFAKTPEYITQRLKLNDLSADLQKDFKQDKMLLGHALLLCRLTPEDQKKAKDDASGKDFRNESVQSVKEWIEESVIQNLTKVPWQLNDATLFPQAGACSACAKRSGAGNLLFKDMADDNRCFDSACFEIKKQKQFLHQLKEIVETKPELHILDTGHGKISQEVNKFLQSMKIKPLIEYDHFKTSDDSTYQVKAKGFYISGNYNQGKIATVYLKGKKNAAAKAAGSNGEKINAAVTIAGIKERTRRAAELDREKVYARILEAVKKHSTQTTIDEKIKTIPGVEDVAMLMMVYNYADFKATREIEKKLKIGGNPETIYKKLQSLSNGEITWMIRVAFFSRHGGNYPTYKEAYVIRKLATGYDDIPIATFEQEQKEIRQRREQRAGDRIAALQKKGKDKKNKIKQLEEGLSKKIVEVVKKITNKKAN